MKHNNFSVLAIPAVTNWSPFNIMNKFIAAYLKLSLSKFIVLYSSHGKSIVSN